MTDMIDLVNGQHTTEQRVAAMEQQITALGEALNTAHSENERLRLTLVEQRSLTAQAEARVTEARQQGETALEAFKAKASEVLGHAADERDLCEVYDGVAEQAGLYPRPRNHDVEIEVSYRQTVTINDLTWDRATAYIQELTVSSSFEPGLPFATGDRFEDAGSPYDISVSIPDLA